MRRAAKGIWNGTVIVVILDLMVLMSHGKAPNKLPSSSAHKPVYSSLPLRRGTEPSSGCLIYEGARRHGLRGPLEVFRDTMLTTKGKPWHESDGDDMVMPST